MKQTSPVNKILAVFFSILFFISGFISFFSLPLEMIFFNPDQISSALDEGEASELAPTVISELTGDIIYSSYRANEVPEILDHKDDFKSILVNYVPKEWAAVSIRDFVRFTLDFINFRSAESSLNLDINEWRKELMVYSQSIANEIYTHREACETAAELEKSASAEKVTDLPPCRSDGVDQEKNLGILGSHLENQFVKLPATISVDYVLFGEQVGLNSFFNQFALLRWVVRLLPLISVSLLILISTLLKTNRKLQVNWLGRLLIFTSAFSLVVLIITMIGLPQFSSMLLTNFFAELVPGFDSLLLRLIQIVGYKTLLWTSVVSAGVLMFGITLVLTSKLIRGKRNDEVVETVGQEEIIKEIKPETLEEIEERENNN